MKASEWAKGQAPAPSGETAPIQGERVPRAAAHGGSSVPKKQKARDTYELHLIVNRRLGGTKHVLQSEEPIQAEDVPRLLEAWARELAEILGVRAG